MTVMETDRLGYPVLIGQLIDSCPELKRLIEDLQFEIVASDSANDNLVTQ